MPGRGFRPRNNDRDGYRASIGQKVNALTAPVLRISLFHNESKVLQLDPILFHSVSKFESFNYQCFDFKRYYKDI